MRSGLIFAAVIAALIFGAAEARADTIAFDDALAANGEGSNPATFYLVSDGLTIGGTYYGTVGGVSNGDVGNWNLDGTNGPAFLGNNSGDGAGPSFSWSSAVSGVSLDVGLPGFGWVGTFTVRGYLGASLVSTDVVNLASADGPDGPWGTATLTGVIDSVTITASYTSGFAFGVDNVSWADGAAVPEPGSIALLGLGLVGLGIASRRRKARAS